MTEKKKSKKVPVDPEEEKHRAVSNELIRHIREQFAESELGRELQKRVDARGKA